MPDLVTQEFNRICTNAGVQCTITLDPRDWSKVYQFKHLGTDPVEISYGPFFLTLHPFEYTELRPGRYEVKATQWFVRYKSQVAIPPPPDAVDRVRDVLLSQVIT